MKHYFWLLSFSKPYTGCITITWMLSVIIIFLQTVTIWISVQCIQNVLQDNDYGSSTSSNAVLLWLNRLAEDVLSNRAPHETLIVGAVFLSITLFSVSLLRYAKSYIFVNIKERILAQVRFDIFRHISMMDLLFTQSKKTGEIESLLFYDVDNLSRGLIDSLDRVFMQPLRILFFTYLLFQLSPWLTSVLYCVIGISFVVTHYFGKFLEHKSRIMMEKTASLHGNAVEYLILAILARIFNKEEFEQHRWRQKCDELARARVISLVYTHLLPVSANLVKAISLLLIISIGAKLVYVENSLSAADLAKTILLVPMLLYPIEAMATLYGSIRTSLASIKRIRRIFDEPTTLPQEQEDKRLPPVEDPIFPIVGQDVCKTIAQREILSKLNFYIEKGETVTIYGTSGSGKSTLLSIIAGLCFADSGEVFLGTNRLSETDYVSWRNRLAIVLQDSIFFNATIRENLHYAEPSCSDEEMLAALRLVFPNDPTFRQSAVLDQTIGNLGKNLSGGERQRLSIARALLKKPDLLILDEPTSDLDLANRRVIYQTLAQLRGSLTMLIATHDDELRHIADRVYKIGESTIIQITSQNAN